MSIQSRIEQFTLLCNRKDSQEEEEEEEEEEDLSWMKLTLLQFDNKRGSLSYVWNLTIELGDARATYLHNSIINTLPIMLSSFVGVKET